MSHIKSSQHKIAVDENGQRYLIPAHQDLKAISLEEKSQALHKYENSKAEIASLDVLMKQDMAKIFSHLAAMDSNKDMSGADKMDSNNQANLVQSSVASMNALLNDSDLDSPAPRLIPRPQPTQKATAKKSVRATVGYRNALRSFINNPTHELIEEFKRGYDAKAHPIIDRIIRSGHPVSVLQMRALLQSIERFGVSAYKPSVSSIPRPTPFKKNPFE